MKYTAPVIAVFLVVALVCAPIAAAPKESGRGGGAGGRPKNNWKNEICTELGHLLLEAEKINELKHCSTTVTGIRDGINERVTIIRQILNNHGALCSPGAGDAQQGTKFNKNSFD